MRWAWISVVRPICITWAAVNFRANTLYISMMWWSDYTKSEDEGYFFKFSCYLRLSTAFPASCQEGARCCCHCGAHLEFKWLSISISGQGMQRIPSSRAFTIHFRRKSEEEATNGEQSPSKSHYWSHIQMREFCESQTGITITMPSCLPQAWNSPCCKSSTLKLAILYLQTHRKPWQGTRACQGHALHVPCSCRKGRCLQGLGPHYMAVIQHLSWCLLTTASLTACVFKSQEIAAYNGRKRPFRCCLWSLGFKIKTSSICQQT